MGTLIRSPDESLTSFSLTFSLTIVVVMGAAVLMARR